MSCLFDSLSRFLSIDSYSLRQQLCDYLSTNPKLFDDIDTSDWISWENNYVLSDYINNMRKSYTWGGGIEIKAFCNIYKAQVIIRFLDRNITFYPNDPPEKIININYTGNHFS